MTSTDAPDTPLSGREGVFVHTAPRAGKVRRTFPGFVAYLLTRGASWPIEQAPLTVSLWFARRLGTLVYFCLRHRRRIAIDNLRHAYGHRLTERQLRRFSRKAFQGFVMTIVEGIRVPIMIQRGQIGDLIEFEGPFDEMQRFSQRGEGLVLVSGHLGSWEVLMGALSLLRVRAAAVVRPLRNGYIDAWVRRTRARAGQELIYSHGAFESVRRALKGGISVGILVDQNARRGIVVDFFDRRAKTSPVVGILASRYRHPVFIGACQRVVPGRRYRVLCVGPVPFDLSGNPKDRIARVTQECTGILEKFIRQMPEQWLWLHDRWKHRAARD